MVDEVEREARAGQRQLETAAAERLAALPADLQGDPAAVGQEIVRFVARSDVDEELVRLRAPFRALARASPTARNRAAGSSISCCRK